MMAIGLSLGENVVVDSTPGGVNNVLLLETADGLLLEDGSFLILDP